MKKYLFFAVFTAAAFSAFCQTPSFRPQFSLSTNNDMSTDDFYDLQGSLRLVFTMADDIELIFRTELDKYEVDVEELSAVYNIDRTNSVKTGKFENPLTLDDYLGSFVRLFARTTTVTREVKKQGYVTKSIGLKYEKKDNKSDTWNYFGHLIYIPSQMEPQINGGFFYRTGDEKHLTGFIASYFPFVNHKSWSGDSSYPNLHNILVSLIYTDYRNSFIYGAELTVGSNLVNPVGLINYSPDTDFPVFAGIDVHAGIKYYLSPRVTWTPLVRVTALHPEISEIECRDIDIVWGNRFGYGENLRLNLDLGPGFITRYDSYGDDGLKTKLEWRWAFSLVIKGD